MLLVTDKGLYYTVVEDFDDPTVLWARSQDRKSVEEAAVWLEDRFSHGFPVINEPTWDYQFRVKVSREEWGAWLAHQSYQVSAHKLKPAVAQARGALHPISRMVEEVFYFMSENRPDGSKPGWLRGVSRKKPAK